MSDDTQTDSPNLSGDREDLLVWVKLTAVLLAVAFALLYPIDLPARSCSLPRAAQAYAHAAQITKDTWDERVKQSELLKWLETFDLYPLHATVASDSTPQSAHASEHSGPSVSGEHHSNGAAPVPTSSFLALALFPDWMDFSVTATNGVLVGEGAGAVLAPVFDIEGVAVEVIPRAPHSEEEKRIHLQSLHLQMLRRPRALYMLAQMDTAARYATCKYAHFKEWLESEAFKDMSMTSDNFKSLSPRMQWWLENGRTSTVFVMGGTEYRLHYWTEDPAEGEVRAITQHLQIQIRPWTQSL